MYAIVHAQFVEDFLVSGQGIAQPRKISRGGFREKPCRQCGRWRRSRGFRLLEELRIFRRLSRLSHPAAARPVEAAAHYCEINGLGQVLRHFALNSLSVQGQLPQFLSIIVRSQRSADTLYPSNHHVLVRDGESRKTIM